MNLNTQFEKMRRLQEKIDESKKKLDNFSIELQKIRTEITEMDYQHLWCYTMSLDNEMKQLNEQRQKKGQQLISTLNSRTKEQQVLNDLEDLLKFMKDDPKRTERLFTHL